MQKYVVLQKICVRADMPGFAIAHPEQYDTIVTTSANSNLYISKTEELPVYETLPGFGDTSFSIWYKTTIFETKEKFEELTQLLEQLPEWAVMLQYNADNGVHIYIDAGYKDVA